jgi:hypothetical protein
MDEINVTMAEEVARVMDAQSRAEQARDELVSSLHSTASNLQANINKLGALAAAKGPETKAAYDAEVRPALEERVGDAAAIIWLLS